MHMFAVQNKYDLELDIISHSQIVLIIPVPLLQRIQMLLEIQLFEICKWKYPISWRYQKVFAFSKIQMCL